MFKYNKTFHKNEFTYTETISQNDSVRLSQIHAARLSQIQQRNEAEEIRIAKDPIQKAKQEERLSQIQRHDEAEEIRIAKDKADFENRKAQLVEFLTTASPENLLNAIAEQHLGAADHEYIGHNRSNYHADTRNWLTQIYLHQKVHPIKEKEHDLLGVDDDNDLL